MGGEAKQERGREEKRCAGKTAAPQERGSVGFPLILLLPKETQIAYPLCAVLPFLCSHRIPIPLPSSLFLQTSNKQALHPTTCPGCLS